MQWVKRRGKNLRRVGSRMIKWRDRVVEEEPARQDDEWAKRLLDGHEAVLFEGKISQQNSKGFHPRQKWRRNFRKKGKISRVTFT